MAKEIYETILVNGGLAGQSYDLNQGPLLTDIIDALLQNSGGLATLQENAPLNLISTGTLLADRTLSLVQVENPGRIFHLQVSNSDISTNTLTIAGTNNINGEASLVITDPGEFLFIYQTSGDWQVQKLWTPLERSNLELELAFKAAILTYYQEMTYSGTTLTAVDVYTDNTKVTPLFNKTFSYTGNKLTQTVLTRLSDSATLTQVLAYTGNNLVSITRS